MLLENKVGILKMDSPEGATGENNSFQKNKVGFLEMDSPEGAAGGNKSF